MGNLNECDAMLRLYCSLIIKLYLVNKNIVEVICEASSKSVSELCEEVLLLLHCRQLLMT